MFIVKIHDKTSSLQLRFFYFNKTQMNKFKIGRKIRCYGEIRHLNNIKEIVHPEYQIFEGENLPELDEYLTPVYPLTEGFHQNSLRNFYKTIIVTSKTKIIFPKFCQRKF